MSFSYSLFLGSIASVKVVITTKDLNGNHRHNNNNKHRKLQLKIVLYRGSQHIAELNMKKGEKKEDGKDQRYEEKLNTESDFYPPLDCTRRDIRNVYLKASKGKNKWYVSSIDTYTKESGSHRYTQLTADPGFSMWVDGDNNNEYPYDATKHLLTNATAGSCITYIRVNTNTKRGDIRDIRGAHSSKTYLLCVQLHNQRLCAELKAPTQSKPIYTRELNFRSWFRTTECVSISDIKKVYLEAKRKSWYIESFKTSAKTGEVEYMDLTSDPHLNKWLGRGGAESIKLTWAFTETVNCEYGNPTCKCKRRARVCIFNLEIDEIRTFTSYQKLSVDEPTGIAMRGSQGVIYYFNESGTPQPLPLQAGRNCSTLDSSKCTNPQFVDGKTYRLAIAVNGQIPGPTLIVHEGQEVVIHVHNNLTTEGISIHWHGMHQRGTPWMDGVGQVTQCQIGPSSSFSYEYIAEPAGTFWYHSHSGAQRTDGFYAALIVKESDDRMIQIREKLPPRYRAFEDLPGEHTLTLLDWQHEASLDLFTQAQADLGFYPDTPLGEVPTPNDTQYNGTRSFDNGGAGPVPYFSGIVNGKGRHVDVPYRKTRLSIFTVESGKIYRFRLIGAQSLYSYNFSVDGHKLTVVGTDGYWINPVEEVDYIMIHPGERYDFLLAANATKNDYWMHAETMEINQTSKSEPPYESLGHVAEAILHYRNRDDTVDPNDNVPSTKYQYIKNNSPVRNCTEQEPCKAVNCPFQNFHHSYNINCVNVHNLSLLEQTPPGELPNANPKSTEECPNCRHFLNFHFEGDSQTSSVNGRNFILPSFPPQAQYEDFEERDTICSLTADCNPSTPACSCVHVIDIPYKETIQMVFSSIASTPSAHPIHLHGHTFHVVHVGYPQYNHSTGYIRKSNSDIACDDVNCTKEGCNKEGCTMPRWNEAMNFTIDSHTIRKDTVMVPAGGYVVINFLSDNPGQWFLHCHKELHQLEGMAVIVNEALKEQGDMKQPTGLNKCGDFEINYNKPYGKYQSQS